MKGLPMAYLLRVFSFQIVLLQPVFVKIAG
jgi:hypothetical protein